MNRTPRPRLSGLLAIILATACPALHAAQTEFSGRLSVFGSYGHAGDGSYLQSIAGSDLLDQAADLRLMFDTQLAKDLTLQLHYDLAESGGDTRGAGSAFAFLPGDPAGPNDDHRLFNLSHELSRGPRSLVYHRLDRLALHWKSDWGSVTVGRTAVTWGNGLVFNVQDLFNPFDPRDIIRDYKNGDDLMLVETTAGGTDWQFLAVPRRDPSTGRFSAPHSSLAAHFRFNHSDVEWTGFAGVHYDEPVAGFGRVATVGGAIWRSDVLFSRRTDGSLAFSALTNVDYSWEWFGKNCYGLVEAHYNSLGHSDPWDALQDPDLAARLSRGEIFTLGPAYLAGTVQVEFHPLLNGAVTTLVDLAGPSVNLQPRLVWDVRQDLQLILGAQLSLGARGTEYGGIVDPASGLEYQSPATVFLWLRAWF